jgi:hypothetical protein
MRPRVDGNLVASHILLLKKVRVRDRTRADNEHGRLEVVLVKVLKEVRRVPRWAVIICQAPLAVVRACRDVRLTRAAAASPPAARGITGCSSVVACATNCRGRRSDVRDVDTGSLDLGNPLLNLGSVRIRNNIERWVGSWDKLARYAENDEQSLDHVYEESAHRRASQERWACTRASPRVLGSSTAQS